MKEAFQSKLRIMSMLLPRETLNERLHGTLNFIKEKQVKMTEMMADMMMIIMIMTINDLKPPKCLVFLLLTRILCTYYEMLVT